MKKGGPFGDIEKIEKFEIVSEPENLKGEREPLSFFETSICCKISKNLEERPLEKTKFR